MKMLRLSLMIVIGHLLVLQSQRIVASNSWQVSVSGANPPRTGVCGRSQAPRANEGQAAHFLPCDTLPWVSNLLGKAIRGSSVVSEWPGQKRKKRKERSLSLSQKEPKL